MARAQFRLDNKRLAFNASDLAWTFGSSHSLSPFSKMAARDAAPELFTRSVQPYGVGIYFEYNYDGQGAATLEATLEVSYGVTKDATHANHSFGATLPFLSQEVLKVQGKVYSNGVGESQLPFVFGAICKKLL